MLEKAEMLWGNERINGTSTCTDGNTAKGVAPGTISHDDSAPSIIRKNTPASIGPKESHETLSLLRLLTVLFMMTSYLVVSASRHLCGLPFSPFVYTLSAVFTPFDTGILSVKFA